VALLEFRMALIFVLLGPMPAYHQMLICSELSINCCIAVS